MIAAQVSETLDAAHSKDVIHRDLKRSNVMLTQHGVTLLDFGLETLRDGDYRVSAHEPTKTVPMTRAGDLLGTLPYMAPEQIEGHDIDRRTDIFSFGVMLYEMLTGRRPFDGSTRSGADRRHRWRATAVSIEPATGHLTAARASHRALSRQGKQERWQTARDLATELEGLRLKPSAEPCRRHSRIDVGRWF